MATEDTSRNTDDNSILGKRKWSLGDLAVDGRPNLPPRPNIEFSSTADIPDNGSTASANKRLRIQSSLEPITRLEAQNVPHLTVATIETVLPGEILQYIFSFLDPLTLGRVICVSRLFRTLLDPSKPLPSRSQNVGQLFLRPQDSIWSVARKRWCSNMPRPMSDMNEYDSFSLALGRDCQFCGTKPATQITSPLTKRPGNDSIRIIWPFRIRSCLNCLQPLMTKEIDVLLSPNSFVIRGLAAALFSSSMHFIPATIVRQANLSQDLALSKYFYRKHIDNLEMRYSEAKSLGAAVLEEWLKGLDDVREKAYSDAARFEQWENLDGPISTLRMLKEVTAQGKPSSSDTHLSHQSQLHNKIRDDSTAFNVFSHSAYPVRQMPTLSLGSLPSMPLQPVGLAPGQALPGKSSRSASDSASMNSQKGRSKPPKSVRDLTKICDEKELDIQRRCLSLNPPIYPEQLEDLPAFQAALVISKPLDNIGWDTLKERLLSQIRDVQIKENAIDSIVEAPVPGEYNPQKLTPEMLSVNAKKSVREKLYEYGEDYIRHKWSFGSYVDYANAPQFAADVLEQVKSRFYQVQAEEQRVLSASEIYSHTEPDYLTLEHMKWVFEQNVKRRTENIRKDLFLCSVCNLNGAKYFAFDSIVQHYASKHTDELGRGQQTVYWKSRWPDQPIFNPHPDRNAISHNMMRVGDGSSLPEVLPFPLPPPPPMSAHYVRTTSSGRRSPGTLSMASTQTGILPVQSSIKQKVAFNPGPPGIGIYHMQRDVLTVFILQSWHELQQVSHLPITLKVYILLHRSIRLFREKYANEPPLSLFHDCIDNKEDLRNIRVLGDLRCKRCIVLAKSAFSRADSASQAFRLVDLLRHFSREHLDQGQRGPKVLWTYDMIELPPSSVVNQFANARDLPDSMRDLLKDAFISSFSDGDSHHSGTVYAESHIADEVSENVRTQDVVQNDSAPKFPIYTTPGNPTNIKPHNGQSRQPDFHQLLESSSVQKAPRYYQIPPTVPTHGYSTAYEKFDEPEGQHRQYVRRYIPLDPSYDTHNDSFEKVYLPYPREQQIVHISTNHEKGVIASSNHSAAMSRSSTLRPEMSSHTEQTRPASTTAQVAADDFLSALENMADTEMERDNKPKIENQQPSIAQSPHDRHFGALQSLPVETAEIQRADRRIFSTPPTNAADLTPHGSYVSRLPRSYQSQSPPMVHRGRHELSPQPVSVSGHRVVEYDQRGLPIDRGELRYVEVSPLRDQNRPSFDRYGRLVELAHPEIRLINEDRYRNDDVFVSRAPEEIRYTTDQRARDEHTRSLSGVYRGNIPRYYIERPEAYEVIEMENRYDRPPSSEYIVHGERFIPREDSPLSLSQHSVSTEKRTFQVHSPTEYETRHKRR